MSREWKPGDVALIEVGCHANRHVALRRVGGWTCATYPTLTDNPSVVTVVRPLLLLDPEDTGAVQRLMDAYFAEAPLTVVDRMQRAMRRSLDPKLDEPTGHFAVVSDRDGIRWVNWRDPLASHQHERPWVSASDSQDYREWSDIDAVEVLSEGVIA